jgi:hypothetical protein
MGNSKRLATVRQGGEYEDGPQTTFVAGALVV